MGEKRPLATMQYEV
jgi:hypothetical protein